jgi:hypothetical protein
VSEARLETVRLQRGHGHQPAHRVQSLKREYSVYASSARRLIVRPAPRASRSVDAFVIVRLDRWSLRSVIGWLTFLSLPALPRNSRDTASSKLPFGAWEAARVYPGGDPASPDASIPEHVGTRPDQSYVPDASRMLSDALTWRIRRASKRPDTREDP